MTSKSTFSAVELILALAVLSYVFGQSSLSGAPSRTSSSSGASVSGSAPFNFSLTQPSALSQQPNLAITALPSDNSIDENEYIIGSGDVFFITVIESPSIRYIAAVDQSGKAFIPNFGIVSIGKLSYASAKNVIAEYISSKMRNPSEVYITLTQTKKATVAFTGSVRSPGSYEFPGDTRLLDAIKMANDGDLPPVSNANLRQVLLTRDDSVIVFDISAYLHKGDHSQNPYIYPGDKIRINATTNSVFISGAIKTPPSSFYPLKDGETIKEFLSMFTLDNIADTTNILIFQSAGNSKKTFSYSDPDIVLNDLDAITVPVKKNHPGIYTVSISGEIASPGHYPITENSTSARQLIDMAGGMKETGNVSQIAVIRRIKNLPDRFMSGGTQLNVVRPERGSSIAMAAAALDYTIIRLALYNADKVILEPDDQIVIPKKDVFIYISGAVRNPGAYPFLSGKDSRYYIAQAGGFSGNADRSNIQVFVKYGDIVQSIEPRCLEPGSIIIVPSSVQYKFMSQVILPLISTLATTIGVGLAIYNSRSN